MSSSFLDRQARDAVKTHGIYHARLLGFGEPHQVAGTPSKRRKTFHCDLVDYDQVNASSEHYIKLFDHKTNRSRCLGFVREITALEKVGLLRGVTLVPRERVVEVDMVGDNRPMAGSLLLVHVRDGAVRRTFTARVCELCTSTIQLTILDDGDLPIPRELKLTPGLESAINGNLPCKACGSVEGGDQKIYISHVPSAVGVVMVSVAGEAFTRRFMWGEWQRFPEAARADAVVRAIGCVPHAHDCGVLHLDLKPNQFMFYESESSSHVDCRLVDWDESCTLNDSFSAEYYDQPLVAREVFQEFRKANGIPQPRLQKVEDEFKSALRRSRRETKVCQ